MSVTGLLLTDVDGTLPTATEARPVFDVARAMGVRIAVVTARHLESALPVMQRYGLMDQFLAVELGAQVFAGYGLVRSVDFPQTMPTTAAAIASMAGACRLDDWNAGRRMTQWVMLPADEARREDVKLKLAAAGYRVLSSGVTSLVHPAEIDKGTTAAWIRAWLGDPPAMAIGDSDLDVPMVKAIGGHSRIITSPAWWKPAVINWLHSLRQEGGES